jgi:hypothetical protein
MDVSVPFLSSLPSVSAELDSLYSLGAPTQKS